MTRWCELLVGLERVEVLDVVRLLDRLLAPRKPSPPSSSRSPLTIGAPYDGAAHAPPTRRAQRVHVTRMRLSMPATVDTLGGGRLRRRGAVLDGAAASLPGRRAGPGGRRHPRPHRCRSAAHHRLRPARWRPQGVAELHAAGFDVLTYRKKPVAPEPRRAFSDCVHTDESGRHHRYWLADRRVRIFYRDGSARRYFACRQITRLDPYTGH